MRQSSLFHRGSRRPPKQLVAAEKDVLKSCLDLLDVLHIPNMRLQSGNRFGSYTSKRTGIARNWRIKLLPEGTPDIQATPWQTTTVVNAERKPIAVVDIRRVVWIETKTVGGEQREAQKYFQQRAVEEWGDIYLLIMDVGELTTFLEENNLHGR